MSDTRNVCALRLKMGKFNSRNEFYNFLKQKTLLEEGEFKNIEFVSDWLPDEKRFEDTDEVDNFEIDGYDITVDYDTNMYYVDKRLFDISAIDIMELTLSLEEFTEYIKELHTKFQNNNEIKLVVYNWYTGCDEPVYF